jgi:hypothetical protein
LITSCAGLSLNEDDVDALAGELVRHGLHARAAHADAGADRIDAPESLVFTAIFARRYRGRARQPRISITLGPSPALRS